MVRMARDFLTVAAVDVSFDAAWVEASVKSAIAGEDRLALVLDHGGVCGMLCAGISVSPLAPIRVASEQVFWIDPAARGRWARPMVLAFEDWARAQRCNAISLATLPGRSAGALYRRCGFSICEQHYSKGL